MSDNYRFNIGDVIHVWWKGSNRVAIIIERYLGSTIQPVLTTHRNYTILVGTQKLHLIEDEQGEVYLCPCVNAKPMC